MAHGFKESDFQNGIFIPFLTAPPPAGLNWILDKPADIDQARWLVPSDLLQFLRAGCPLNAATFARAVKGYVSSRTSGPRAGLGCSIRQKTTQKLRTRPYKYIS